MAACTPSKPSGLPDSVSGSVLLRGVEVPETDDCSRDPGRTPETPAACTRIKFQQTATLICNAFSSVQQSCNEGMGFLFGDQIGEDL